MCVPEPTPNLQLPFNSGSSFLRLVEHIEPLDSLTNSHVPSCAMLRSGQPLSGCNGVHGSCSPFSRARWLLIGGAARPRPLQAQHHCTFDIFSCLWFTLVFPNCGFSQCVSRGSHRRPPHLRERLPHDRGQWLLARLPNGGGACSRSWRAWLVIGW